MKTILKPFFVFLISIIASYSCLAQEITNKLVKDASTIENTDQLTTKVISPSTNSNITIVSNINGVITYAIVNDAVKNELYYNAEKRDAITALPGFVELGLSTDNTPMRVKIYSEYADEYINKYFRTTTNQTTNN